MPERHCVGTGAYDIQQRATTGISDFRAQQVFLPVLRIRILESIDRRLKRTCKFFRHETFFLTRFGRESIPPDSMLTRWHYKPLILLGKLYEIERILFFVKPLIAFWLILVYERRYRRKLGVTSMKRRDFFPIIPAVLYSASVFGQSRPDAPILESGGHALSWYKPTLSAEGTVLPANFITGYKIYRKLGDDDLRLEQEIIDGDQLSTTVSEGSFAVAATFDGGQTALSDVVEVPQRVPRGVTRVVGKNEAYTNIQTAIDASKPGDVVQLRGEIFRYLGNDGITISVSGTASDPIVIESYPGERAIVHGAGSRDAWYSLTGSSPGGNQTLVTITGDYIHLKNIDVVYSTDHSVQVRSSQGVYLEGIYALNWGRSGRAAIAIMPSNGTDGIYGFVMRYCRAEFTREGIGIGFQPVTVSSPTADIVSPRIERCMATWCGYREDFTLTESATGGGNAGGGIESVWIHPNQNTAYDIHPVKSAVIKECIFYHNADDSLHISAGPNYLILNNTMMTSGPMGNRGIKMKNGAFGPNTQVGNIAYDHRVPGAPSGFGFECRMVSGPLVHWNNSAIYNLDDGLKYNNISTGGGISVSSNSNIGYLNGGSNIRTPAGEDYSVANNITESDPQLLNAQPRTSVPVHDNKNPKAVQDAWRTAYTGLRRPFMPRAGSPAVDKGTFNASIHTATAADAPINPADPEADKLAWFGTSPDIGAMQRHMVDAPVIR